MKPESQPAGAPLARVRFHDGAMEMTQVVSAAAEHSAWVRQQIRERFPEGTDIRFFEEHAPTALGAGHVVIDLYPTRFLADLAAAVLAGADKQFHGDSQYVD